MDGLAVYREVGSFRGAAVICGTTRKTVKRIVERHEADGAAAERTWVPIVDAALREGRIEIFTASPGEPGPPDWPKTPRLARRRPPRSDTARPRKNSSTPLVS